MVFKDSPWLNRHGATVKLLGPVCVAYGHPDLEATHRFLTDFGLVKTHSATEGGIQTVYYRGYGVQPVVYLVKETPKPQFLGAYFEAASEEDLEKATRIPGASSIRECFEGGREVVVRDPTGHVFHVVHGMKKREFSPPPAQLSAVNYPAAADGNLVSKPRRGRYQRMAQGRVPVHKLGHIGYVVRDVDESIDFYCRNFNFKPTDIMLGPDDQFEVCFLHIDLGSEYSDHHSFFLVAPMGKLRPGAPHHAAFEIESIDTQFIAHDYLVSQGYKSFWGVGRHVEGSQVFDYWYDLDGFVVEHYADGDLCNADTPVNLVPHKDPHQISTWGPIPNVHHSHM